VVEAVRRHEAGQGVEFAQGFGAVDGGERVQRLRGRAVLPARGRGGAFGFGR